MADMSTEETSVELQDLEDGEIESDNEETQVPNDVENKIENTDTPSESVMGLKKDAEEVYYSKSGKKKKSKNHGKEQKNKEKKQKYRKYSSPIEDDFAGSVEKAIRKALNKNDDGDSGNYEDIDERRKHKKRKKYDGKDTSSKKRKKQEYLDEVDENEMMCIRGASPVQTNTTPSDNCQDDDRDSYASDSSHDSREHQSNMRQQRHRPPQRDRKNKNDRDRRRGAHPMQDPDGVCLYYMQGKCHKGDDCIYSHDAQPPRKMELCKFYLMDCCAKRDKCLYMHSDFPCKFYHTGLPCVYKDDCKFAHGKPLSENLKMILLKHIESAPKEILGDFPRLSREGAANMIANTQMKLMQQYPSESNENQDKSIPSLFELNIPKPQNIGDPNQARISPNQLNYDKSSKGSPKVRQSRWQNDNSISNHNNLLHSNNTGAPVNVLSIKNLNGVLTPKQITDLTKMGIDNLDQLGQLTVLQLNSIGISLKQITEIQLNTMSIQKLGLISSNNETQQTQSTFLTSLSSSKDMDLRVPPIIPVVTPTAIVTDIAGKDVDMRFQSSLPVTAPDDDNNEDSRPSDSRINRDMIDIDQYTKDALKFAAKDKNDVDITSDVLDNETKLLVGNTKDIDQRVLKFIDDPGVLDKTIDSPNEKRETDTDIRFLQPEPLFKNPAKRNRRSTTDDEDNNLLIDEKWYSSDEEKCMKRKSPVESPIPLSPQSVTPVPQVIETASVLSKLGDLSKIDISEEVTKLLHTMKNNLQESKSTEKVEKSDILRRDPRNSAKKSPDRKTSEFNKTISNKSSRVSIYECIEGEPTDGRRRSDVDLRQNDFKLPTFGDTDLRQTSGGDIDFRLGLPFKPLPNYTPASEIDGSFNSHPPISYKLLTIDIPRPDYTDIRNSTAKSQALLDPRLRKVFRLSLDESNSDSEKSNTKSSTAPRLDPRRKQKESTEILIQEQKPSLDLQTVLQTSEWYKELSSKQKIFVNQNLASVTSMLKQYHQDKTSGKKLDLTSIQTTVLCNIFTNLGVTLGENGEFSYLPKQKEALLKTPVNFNQNFGMGGNMEGNNMNLMNVSHMNMSGLGNMNFNQMSTFNPNFPDSRGGPPPGLLGVAPNMPHNFDNKFGGPNNFGNMPYNGPGNDFGDMDNSFQRFSNRGGYRGRGNDRWNRGGASRGNRDRKNYNNNDRGGGWKN